MRYTNIDAQMRRAERIVADGVDHAVRSYLAARRAAKPRARYVEGLNLWRISHKAFVTWGRTLDSACKALIQVHGPL